MDHLKPQGEVLLKVTWMHLSCFILHMAARISELYGRIMFGQFLMVNKVAIYLITMLYV
jgi:hypothetical protein